MYSLYIDTHLSTITLILFKDGLIVDKKEMQSNQSHSIYTMPLVDEIISNNIDLKDLKEIIVVNGPGSFTGVRIGITIAKTMAYTLKIPIKVISSLEVIAVCVNSDLKNILISDKNGKFVGKFDKDNKKLAEYKYISNNNFIESVNDFENVKIDYEKVYAYTKELSSVNVHEVNPVYVKDIEVANG